MTPAAAHRTAAGGGGELTVSIQGKYKFTKETMATWRADVTGGVPPCYYIWTEQVCWIPGDTCGNYLIAHQYQHFFRSGCDGHKIYQ